MSILADTSGLLALLDVDSERHGAARTLLAQEELLVPSSVLCEVDYMVTTRLGAAVAQAFLEDVVSGAYGFLQVEFTDVARALELMRTYADAQVGYVDASVVALAERHRLNRVLTLDRRHFSMFRPKGSTHLELLP